MPLLLNKDKLKFVPPTIIIGIKYAVSKEANIQKNSRECSISIIAYVMGGRPDFKALTERLLRVWQPWSLAFYSLQRLFHNKVPVGGGERPGPKLGPLVCWW